MDINDKMIYCQRDIPKDKWRYGLRSSAATGCGWIAVYNALRLMGYKPDADMLINYFKRQIPLLNGNTGTFVLSPAMFFKKFGFPVKVTAKKSQFDTVAAKADVCIMYFWWRRGAKLGAHFIALHNTPEGFVGYNTYRNSKGPDNLGKSIEKFIENRKYFGAVLMGIDNKK
ncbi:MAG: hypothetical protein IKA10_07395 [Oscillospiraceae bacterium]|nr:hypothetical protein [Oscillospiraceae bacterium]